MWTHSQCYLANKKKKHYLNDLLTKAQTTEIVLFKINNGTFNTRE